uniref:Ig-like domain-containing protein n=1 Tax=Astyanax mexicanus TaxID=7994 RepID=A0A8B9J4Y9_ASTMX
MTHIQCSCLTCSVWILLSFISAETPDNTTLNMNLTHTFPLTLGTIINCNYNKTSEREALTVFLRREQLLCSYYYQLKSWKKQLCKENIKLIWIPETEEVSFELLNLQINDTGVYTCAVERHVPPPVKCLGIRRTFLHVIARPAVSGSCVMGPDKAPTVLCTSEGFYPAAVEQSWSIDDEFITSFNTTHTFTHTQYINTSHKFTHTQNLNTSAVHWNYSINPNGTYSLSSYLHLLTLTPEQVMYTCWVNHSSLNQPITVNISSTDCSEKQELTGLMIKITGITSAVLMGLAIVVCCHIFRRRRAYSHSPRERPQPEPSSQLQFDTYSTLGHHRPIPCRINSGHSTSSSLQLTLNR